jgi:hypothetical protein
MLSRSRSHAKDDQSLIIFINQRIATEVATDKNHAAFSLVFQIRKSFLMRFVSQL